MKTNATCTHNNGYRKSGLINLGSIVPTVIECNCCRQRYYNVNEPTEKGAFKEMKATPFVLNITGFKIESKENTKSSDDGDT